LIVYAVRELSSEISNCDLSLFSHAELQFVLEALNVSKFATSFPA
jgi:hypothetical protein